MAMSLLTFEEAVEACHLSLLAESPPSEPEKDLRLLMDVATALVIDYLKKRDHPWRASTDYTIDPELAVVKGAICKVVNCLWTHRGTEEPYDPLEQVVGMLSGYRKPTMA